MTAFRPFLQLSVLTACALLALAGCGGTDSQQSAADTGTETQAPAQSDDRSTAAKRLAADESIGMRNLKFLPEEVTVKVGQEVTWENLESIPHDAVADNGEFRSELLGKGEKFSWTPEKAGRVPYVCTLHPGMVGVIIVEE